VLAGYKKKKIERIIKDNKEASFNPKFLNIFLKDFPASLIIKNMTRTNAKRPNRPFSVIRVNTKLLPVENLALQNWDSLKVTGRNLLKAVR
jgi:hypothetical protein